MVLSDANDDAQHMNWNRKRTRMYMTSTDTMAAVSAVDITKTYGEGEASVRALCTVSLDVAQGEFLAVMGPSGSGKSTLMHLLAGLDKPTEGKVYIEGADVTTMKDKELTTLRRQRVGFISQAFNPTPHRTAEENIALPLPPAREPANGTPETLLEQVGLTDRRKHKPTELSGGQQQRVAIGRALVNKPTIIFADEPTGNLDSKTSGEILELLERSVKELDQTIVMVTHEARAAAIADRVLFLDDGVIVREARNISAHDIVAAMEELGES